MLQNMTNLMEGFSLAMNLQTLLLVLLGVLVGMIMGAIPGLTGVMAVALMTPFTFSMTPAPALAMLISVFSGANFGGSISAILINTPGTGSAVCTCFDGYPMAQKGEAVRALEMSLLASVAGGVIGWILLVTISPLLAKFALQFGPAEYFAIMLFALTIIASVSQGNMHKGLISAVLGLLVCTIGLDPMNATQRFTFGNFNLASGISTFPITMGLFALVELFNYAESTGSVWQKKTLCEVDFKKRLPLREFFTHWKTVVRGSLMGCVVGAIPGVNGNVMCFANYEMTKRESKDPDSFGKGNIAGVAAVECANNAGGMGSLIPLLTLGVPGGTGTAMLMGAFTLHGIVPGPTTFSTQGGLIYCMFIALFLSNVYLYLIGKGGIRYFAYINKVPMALLYPIILVLCVFGAYTNKSSLFDIKVMIVFAVLGYLMKKLDIPKAPFIIAVLIGSIFEQNFRRMCISFAGKPSQIFTRPIVLFFFALTILSLVAGIRGSIKASKETKM